MTSDKEELIRAKAHEIWLSEGCPDGAETRHWEMALAAIEAEEVIPAEIEAPAEAPAPAPKKRAPRARKTAAV